MINVMYIAVRKLHTHDKPTAHTCDKTTYS